MPPHQKTHEQLRDSQLPGSIQTKKKKKRFKTPEANEIVEKEIPQ